jgi:hypothetical protein
MSHLDEGTLHALLDGELELAEVREIQLHLGTCAACGSRLQDVKQFLAEADRLVGALELPAGGIRSHGEPMEPRRPPLSREPAPEPAPAPKPFREPGNWEEPPVLLIPDPLDGLERRRRWMRGLRFAAMIAAVFLKPSKPELQFTERDLAQPAPPTPAAVSPRETARPTPPVVAKQSRPTPAPSNREQAPKPAPTPTVLADEPAQDSADPTTGQLDTVAAAAEDSAPLEGMVATRGESSESEAAQPSSPSWTASDCGPVPMRLRPHCRPYERTPRRPLKLLHHPARSSSVPRSICALVWMRPRDSWGGRCTSSRPCRLSSSVSPRGGSCPGPMTTDQWSGWSTWTREDGWSCWINSACGPDRHQEHRQEASGGR